MSNYKKLLLLAATLFATTLSLYSQSFSTFSPYSRFGIGEIPNRGYAYNRAIGGISQGVRNGTWVNYLNPASYTSQDSMSFIFDFAIEGSGTDYRTINQNAFNSVGNIHHVAIQFPITRWMGASAGIQPYSNVGYKVRFTETDPYLLSSIGPIKYFHSGTGGITQAFIGTALEPFKNLSVGVNMSYLFGSLEHTTDVVFPSNQPYVDFNKVRSVVVRDIVFSFGAQYSLFLNPSKNLKLTLGATVDNESSINARELTIITYPYGNTRDTISYINSPGLSIDYPRNVSAGFTLEYKNVFLGGFDFSTQDWTNAKFLNVNDSLTRSDSYRIGLQYTPNPYDLRSYFKRVSYRAGYYQTNTYLNFRNNHIKDYGISFGVGLPFRRTNTSFNLSFEAGRRGTTKNNLIQETYGIVNIGFTFYDFWFIKRKFN